MYAFFMGVGFGLPALFRALPERVRESLACWLATVDPGVFGIGAVLVLMVVDVGLVLLAIWRFRRVSLILA